MFHRRTLGTGTAVLVSTGYSSPHCVPTGLEDIVEAEHVGLDVGIRVLDGIAHTSLGCKIDDDLGVILLEDVIDSGLIGDVTTNEVEGGCLKFVETRLLQGHVVIRVHIVDTDDLCVNGVAEQTPHQITANETGGPCYQNCLMIERNLLHILYEKKA